MPFPGLPEDWAALALDPPRASGPAVGRARYRVDPEDFVVEEQLGFEPAGTGSHWLLQVRKRGANTEWVAREIARAAGCRPMDVGFAGMKDRHAVTTQWMTVPAGRTLPADGWAGFRGPDFEVLAAFPHTRKLPRGALETNRFRLCLRDFDGDAERLRERSAAIAARGVPNFFGPQRFGRQAGNLRPFAPARDPGTREPRLDGYALSAGRSLLFNAVLAARIADGSWDRLLPGDLANLDGRGSVFPVTELDDTLVQRCDALDIHPTGPMWGRGGSKASAGVAAFETGVMAGFGELPARLESAGLDASRRSLRLPVRDLGISIDGDRVELAFELRSGGYATTVLRELLDAVDAAAPERADGGISAA
jgi:tRNA pseudouridine13 synthase